MSKPRGVLLYSMNTPYVDYGIIANTAALLIERFLGLPVSVVTDERYSVDVGLFDEVIVVDSKKDPGMQLNNPNTTWRNKERHNYFALSPYDETLVLDSDYLQFNPTLLKLFGTGRDLYLSYKARRTNGEAVNTTEKRIADYGLDQNWATCFYFRKTAFSERFFTLVEYVRMNYAFYAQRFDFDTEQYRNDFAFSVAEHLFTDGYKGVLARNPFPITTAYPSSRIEAVKEDGLVLIGSAEPNGLHFHQNESVHLLNKETIINAYPRFKELFF